MKHNSANDATAANIDMTFAEPHFRIKELAERWGVGRETTRKIIAADNGPGIIRIQLGNKRKHVTFSVSESAARRIHTRLLSGGGSAA